MFEYFYTSTINKISKHIISSVNPNIWQNFYTTKHLSIYFIFCYLITIINRPIITYIPAFYYYSIYIYINITLLNIILIHNNFNLYLYQLIYYFYILA